MFVSVLSLRCKVEQVCEEVVRLPLINMAWEQALAIWGQHSMGADEHRRRMLTHTLYSSTVRATTAIHKFFKQQVHTQMHSGKQFCGYTIESCVWLVGGQAGRQAGETPHPCRLYFTWCTTSSLVFF